MQSTVETTKDRYLNNNNNVLDCRTTLLNLKTNEKKCNLTTETKNRFSTLIVQKFGTFEEECDKCGKKLLNVKKTFIFNKKCVIGLYHFLQI